jgi:hypothetical protein
MIDSSRDYNVHVTFDWNPDGYLNAFTTVLSQNQQTLMISRETAPNAANVSLLGGFPLDGRIALLAQVQLPLQPSRPSCHTRPQLWTSADMSWLSGAAPFCYSIAVS